MQLHEATKGKLMGKRPDSDKWCLISKYTADNSFLLDRDMQRDLADWYRSAHDKLGAFYGWTFMILKEAL